MKDREQGELSGEWLSPHRTSVHRRKTRRALTCMRGGRTVSKSDVLVVLCSHSCCYLRNSTAINQSLFTSLHAKLEPSGRENVEEPECMLVITLTTRI